MAASEDPPPQRGSVISDEEAAALLERRSVKAGEARSVDLAKLRITRGKLPLLETVNQTFATTFGKAINALLKRELQVSLQRIETQKAEDYFATLALPACLDVVAIKPLKGSALFAIDPALLGGLVDCYYGGSGRATQRDPELGPTPSELRFAQMLLKQIFTDLKQAWTPIAPLEFEVIRHESSPSVTDFAGAGEALLVNRFLIEMASGAGTIDYVVPEAALAPVREKLYGAGVPAQPVSSANWRAYMIEHLKGTAVQVRALMGESRLNLRELRGLKTGDVIPVESPGPATLLVGRVPVYSGKFGISRGRNALKLTAPLPVRPGKSAS